MDGVNFLFARLVICPIQQTGTRRTDIRIARKSFREPPHVLTATSAYLAVHHNSTCLKDSLLKTPREVSLVPWGFNGQLSALGANWQGVFSCFSTVFSRRLTTSFGVYTGAVERKEGPLRVLPLKQFLKAATRSFFPELTVAKPSPAVLILVGRARRARRVFGETRAWCGCRYGTVVARSARSPSAPHQNENP